MMQNKGHKDIKIKQLEKRIKQLEANRGTETSTKYKDMIYHNSWHDCAIKELFPVVQETIEKSRNGEWFWVRNWNCKYINVRIDMRDGGAVLCDRGGERISPEQLRYQRTSEE